MENLGFYDKEFVNAHIIYHQLDKLTVSEDYTILDKNTSDINEKIAHKQPQNQKQVIYNDLTENIKKNTVTTCSDININTSHNPVHRKKRSVFNNDVNEIKSEIGYQGELYVYNYLSKMDNIEVNWKSGNAAKYNSTFKGDDGLGYDMILIDKEKNIQKFIEVKTSTSNDIIFYMSNKELYFANQHKQDYEIYFVCIANDTCTVNRLGSIFDFKDGENIFSNDKFKIESSNYKITFN